MRKISDFVDLQLAPYKATFYEASTDGFYLGYFSPEAKVVALHYEKLKNVIDQIYAADPQQRLPNGLTDQAINEVQDVVRVD